MHTTANAGGHGYLLKDNERLRALSCGLLDLRAMFPKAKDALIMLLLSCNGLIIENLDEYVKQA
jgi:hypothetical protein